MATGGDCYEAAGRRITDQIISARLGADDEDPYTLVHGYVTGQGAIAGIRYGHAWLERDGNVYDFSNGRNIVMPKMVYYAFGQINPSECKRYNTEQARKWILKAKHWGPWELEPTEDEKRYG